MDAPGRPAVRIKADFVRVGDAGSITGPVKIVYDYAGGSAPAIERTLDGALFALSWSGGPEDFSLRTKPDSPGSVRWVHSTSAVSDAAELDLPIFRTDRGTTFAIVGYPTALPGQVRADGDARGGRCRITARPAAIGE